MDLPSKFKFWQDIIYIPVTLKYSEIGATRFVKLLLFIKCVLFMLPWLKWCWKHQQYTQKKFNKPCRCNF